MADMVVAAGVDAARDLDRQPADLALALVAGEAVGAPLPPRACAGGGPGRMRTPRAGAARACFGLGLALGTMTLSRENAMVFPFVLVPWLLLRRDLERRERRNFATVFLCGISLVLFPVAVRNWTVGGEFHLTTSQFGHNFYIGNNPAADGTYAPLIVGRGAPRKEGQAARDLAQRALGTSRTPSALSRF